MQTFVDCRDVVVAVLSNCASTLRGQSELTVVPFGLFANQSGASSLLTCERTLPTTDGGRAHAEKARLSGVVGYDVHFFEGPIAGLTTGASGVSFGLTKASGINFPESNPELRQAVASHHASSRAPTPTPPP